MKKEINVKTSSSHRGDYYPFGMTIPGSVETAAFENKNLYNSKELVYDHNLNWYHYGARYYDPQLGRWLQVDPADEFYSPYVYCHNDPVNFLDPDGQEELNALRYAKTNLIDLEYSEYGKRTGSIKNYDEKGVVCNEFAYLSYIDAGHDIFPYNLYKQQEWFKSNKAWTTDKNAGEKGDLVYFTGHVAMIADVKVNKSGVSEYALVGANRKDKPSGYYLYG